VYLGCVRNACLIEAVKGFRSGLFTAFAYLIDSVIMDLSIVDNIQIPV
jgi:hypothetical protein